MYDGLIDTFIERLESMVKLIYWIGFGHGAAATAIVLLVLFVLFGRRSS